MIEYGHLNRLINLQVADNKKYYKKEKDEAFFIEKLKESLNRGENEYLDDISEYNQLDLQNKLKYKLIKDHYQREERLQYKSSLIEYLKSKKY